MHSVCLVCFVGVIWRLSTWCISILQKTTQVHRGMTLSLSETLWLFFPLDHSLNSCVGFFASFLENDLDACRQKGHGYIGDRSRFLGEKIPHTSRSTIEVELWWGMCDNGRESINIINWLILSLLMWHWDGRMRVEEKAKEEDGSRTHWSSMVRRRSEYGEERKSWMTRSDFLVRGEETLSCIAFSPR